MEENRTRKRNTKKERLERIHVNKEWKITTQLQETSIPIKETETKDNS